MACDSIIRNHAPSENAVSYSPSDSTLSPVFRELGATAIQYSNRLDWEPVAVFVLFTSSINHGDDHVCAVRWSREVSGDHEVDWNTPGELFLFKPVARQRVLWRGDK
jgi:hypothetical protein